MRYRLIKEYKDCAILQDINTDYYYVKEFFDGDFIVMTDDISEAEKQAEEYDFNDIVNIRHKKFNEYLERIK